MTAPVAPTTRLPRTLICEGEGITAMLLRKLLLLAGYEEVEVTTDLEQAVRIGKSSRWDLILLDLAIASPVDTLTAVQAILTHAFVPILIFTGYDPETYLQPVLEAGACGLLQKPFSSSQLLQTIQAVLTYSPTPEKVEAARSEFTAFSATLSLDLSHAVVTEN